MTSTLKYLRLWTGLIFLLAGFPAWSFANPEWFTRVWQTDDGLLDNDVNGIVQGPNNYLWLVTPEGVMQFDGANFTPFTIGDNTSQRVRIILYSRAGVLWMAYDGGKIIGINPDFSTVSLDGNKLPNRPPLALADGGDGTLWLGYSDAIYRVQNGQIIKLAAKDGVPPGIFHSLISDRAGNIWLAKGSQISCFRDGAFQSIASVDGVQGVAATDTNAIWLVAGANLYFCDTNGQLQDCGSFENVPSARGVALLEDESGAVWIGTAGNGLFRYNQSSFQRVESSHSFILSLAKDHEGNIWVGTAGGGLDRITPCGIRLEVQDGQMQSQIQSICQDAKGDLWGATQSGMLVSRTNDSWDPVFTNASFAGTVNCVAANRNGLWVGTRQGALLKINGTNCVIWQTNLVNGPINGLCPSPNGDFWIAGRNMVQHLHRKRVSTIKLPRQVQRIYAITRDASGGVWVGADSMLLRFDGTNMFDMISHLGPGRTICCLYGTSDGSLWIGSSGGGLMRLKNGRMDQIGLDQGLVSDYISQIVADNYGWLWFGSKHGIFKLKQRDIERAMEDTNICLRPILYGKNEGLISQEAVFSIATPFILPRGILSTDGRVWMLMHTGVVVADPDALSENLAPPPILLTQMAMDGKVILSHNGAASVQTVSGLGMANEPLEIPPSHRHLEFDFTAFHFKAPENLHFRYQLVHYDSDWISPAGALRSAAYSRLAAGDYQFRVAACVGDGPWSYPPAVLDFTVVPFFWQTWWFRVGVLLLFTLSLIAIVRYVSYRRLRLKLRVIEQQAAVERERGRIARDIHDDLGNRLTEIQLLTGLAQRNREIPKKAVTHIHEISSAARQATDALDEIVWAINPRNDTLPHLINYLGQFTTDYLRTAGISCRVDLPENPPAKSVSAEVRHNLFLAIKESLNNIVRHANATEVSLLILATDQSLSVIIQDNGRGFNGEIKHSGADGLENMRRRVAEIGGQFQVKSNPGAGTCVSFSGLWLAEK